MMEDFSSVKCDETMKNTSDPALSSDTKSKTPPCFRRRKTWPRLVPCISDIIYWEDGDAVEIGEGFFSNVYKFFHRPSGFTVVVKASKGDNAWSNEEDQAVMLKEIKLLKKLSHKNIIKYFGLCAKNGKFHPVLEYINGGGLDRLLVNYNIALSWSEKIGFCRDVAEGMQYLHSKHIFHRDLKSTNCLIRLEEGGSRTIIVADFGLAREVAGDTRIPRKMSMVGTAFWMAPELINGKLYNIKADVFSYGILACEILARVISDPDDLPRTPNFGLDLEKFSGMCGGCPQELLEMVRECTEVNNPLKRPSFDEIVQLLNDLESGDDSADYEVIQELLSDIEKDDVIMMREPDSEKVSVTSQEKISVTSQPGGHDDNSELLTSQSITNETGIRMTAQNNGDMTSQHDHNGNEKVFSRKLPERVSNLSNDSGFGEYCSECVNELPDVDERDVTNEKLPPKPSNRTKLPRKKVSFRFVASILSGRRRFKNDVIHEDIAPSRGLSLKRSSSLPDLKETSSQPRERTRTVTVSGNKERPKTMYVTNTGL